MEILKNYSGIVAIFVYGFILWVILKVNSIRKHKAAEAENSISEAEEKHPLDLNDEDAVVACLTAAIDCRQQMHKNVEIISVRRIA